MDEEGIPTWSEWLAAAPENEALGGGAQVQYSDEGAMLVIPANGPTQAIVSDASGRTVAALELSEGHNVLPWAKAGVYFIRFPFRPGTLRFVVR